MVRFYFNQKTFVYFSFLWKDGGIREEDREQLDNILSQVSTQSKSGEYIILKSLLMNGEVSFDWPYYPKAEASSVRKYLHFFSFIHLFSIFSKENSRSTSKC